MRFSDIELVGIISHELGHLLHNHAPAKGMTFALAKIAKWMAPIAVFLSGHGMLLAIVTYPIARSVGSFISGTVSRKAEFEADTAGVMITVESGHDDQARIKVLRKYQQNQNQINTTGRRNLEDRIGQYLGFLSPRAVTRVADAFIWFMELKVLSTHPSVRSLNYT